MSRRTCPLPPSQVMLKKPGLPTLIDSVKFLQARRIIIKILQANQAQKNELQATANYYQREGKTRKN